MSIGAISSSPSLDYAQYADQATGSRPTPPPPPAGSGPDSSGGPGGSGGATPPAMTNTASLLGISTDALSHDLRSGQTLSSLASGAGVASSDLVSAVEQDMSANAPSGAPTPSGDQLAQMATDFIDGVRPGGPDGSSSSGADGAGDVSYASSGGAVSNALVSGSLYDVLA